MRVLRLEREQGQEIAHQAGGHHQADNHEQSAGDHVDGPVVLFDQVESRFQPVDQDGAGDKGDAKPQGKQQQHRDPLHPVAARCGQHQRGAEERADAGRPADGKDQTEHHRRPESQLALFHVHLPVRVDKGDPDDAEEIEPEQDDRHTGDDVDHGFVFPKQAAEGAGECPQRYEHQGEPKDKAERIEQGALFPVFGVLAGEIGNIDRQHGQQTWRNKSDDAFQE